MRLHVCGVMVLVCVTRQSVRMLLYASLVKSACGPHAHTLSAIGGSCDRRAGKGGTGINLSGLDFGSLGGKQHGCVGRLWRFGSVGSCLLGQRIILRPLDLWLPLMYVIEPLAALHR